jgi:hypothetical protein
MSAVVVEGDNSEGDDGGYGGGSTVGALKATERCRTVLQLIEECLRVLERTEEHWMVLPLTSIGGSHGRQRRSSF